MTPLAPVDMVPLRSCAAGAGHWAGHVSGSLSVAGEAPAYLCPAHTAAVLSAPIRVGDVVRLIDGHHGPNWRVVAVGAGVVVCGPPGTLPAPVSVHIVHRADVAAVCARVRCGPGRMRS